MKNYSYGDASELRSLVGGPKYPGIATRTYYLNPSTGNDSNDGLSVGSPILTLDHFWNNILPDMINQTYVLYLAAGTTPTDTGPNGGYFSEKFFTVDGSVKFYGEDALDYTGSGGEMVVTSGDVDFSTFSPSPGWTTDEHKGKLAHDKTAGEIRQILSNTADTLNFVPHFSADTTGDTLEIATQASKIDGYTAFFVTGMGNVTVAQIDHIGQDYFEFYGSGLLHLSRFCSDGSLWVEGMGAGYRQCRVRFYGFSEYGPSFLDNGGVDHYVENAELQWDRLGFMRNWLDILHCNIQAWNMDGGVIEGSVTLDTCELVNDYGFGGITIDAGSSYSYALDIRACKRMRITGVTSLIGGSVAGMRVQSSQVIVNNSSLYGSNGSYGVLLRHGAQLRLKSGATPTVYGATAEVADNAGTSTWAAIQGGTPLVNTNEMTVATVDDIADWDD